MGPREAVSPNPFPNPPLRNSQASHTFTFVRGEEKMNLRCEAAVVGCCWSSGSLRCGSRPRLKVSYPLTLAHSESAQEDDSPSLGPRLLADAPP